MTLIKFDRFTFCKQLVNSDYDNTENDDQRCRQCCESGNR